MTVKSIGGDLLPEKFRGGDIALTGTNGKEGRLGGKHTKLIKFTK
jgi:hypothetical protein